MFNPVVSMNANIGSEPVGNYTAEYNAIYATGARGAQTAAPWNSLETTPNPPVTGPTYDLTMVNNSYFGLDALAGYGFTSILINIPIVAISARTMPADIATFDGATSTQTANVAGLNANMDVIILTYYPTVANFVVRAPSTVSADMAAMVTIAAGKPLVSAGMGLPPSSSVLSSSESMQSQFITNTFSAWRQYGSDRIPFISFFKRRDWSATYCATLTGQASGQPFYEFMCSLGLLNNDGISKAAYSAFTTELSNL